VYIYFYSRDGFIKSAERSMQSLWCLAPAVALTIGFAIPLAPSALAQEAVVVGDNCSAVARQGNGQLHEGSGRSLQQAQADAMSKCRASARYPRTCEIETAHCNIAQNPGAISNDRWIDGLRQKKIPVNWESGFAAVVIHLLWLWHIVSQKTLALPAKAGLGFGVPVIQAVLAYVLGGDGEIGLLELPIFALPLGLGELVASVSFKRRSE
jgi:hypothetical protein